MTSHAPFLSFHLPDTFVDRMERDLPDPWEGNVMGHIAFLRTYSRRRTYDENGHRIPDREVPVDGLPEGWSQDKERWADVVRRCVEGAYSIQRDWCQRNRIPWSDEKATRSAMEMFSRMYRMKFTPPGRGLWMMGTSFVHEQMGAAALQNCAFVSTEHDPIRAAEFLMEASMLGVGVGFDTRGAGEWVISPTHTFEEENYVIPDSREGWVESVVRMLRYYLDPDGAPMPSFDYSRIRPKGSPIRGFGGVAAGPEPLKKLHREIYELFGGRDGEVLTERDIVDLMNLIGVCVVAGNVRRSAEIALGSKDEGFLNLKNYDMSGEARHPAAKGRAGHGWASNNSVVARTQNGGGGAPYQDIADLIVKNGEPGVFWLDVSQQYGRLGDPPTNADYRATGTNPCGEQTLESFEMCNLVETFPTRHEDREDYLRTLKFAYLYAKSVTLLPTHWPETNAIMLRNRRIGCSITGIFQFAEERGLPKLREWMDSGYHEIQRWDNIYSEWLCVRESIKTTSVKPSGTVSKLAKVTAGVHAPVARYWTQRIILGAEDRLLHVLAEAGLHVEPSVYSEGSYVVEIPVEGPQVRTQDEVSMWEKASLAALVQREWADNSVSVTIDFDPETEGRDVANLLHAYEGQLKAVSFLPRDAGEHEQLPMEKLSSLDYVRATEHLSYPDFGAVYSRQHSGQAEAHGDKFCDSDVCEIPDHP